MDLYLNNFKMSKNPEINIIFQKIKHNIVDFEKDYLFNDFVNDLCLENSFNSEAIKRFKIALYEYYSPYYLHIYLRALFSKLPFSRIQEWSLEDNSIKISTKRYSLDVGFIILFHSETLENFKIITEFMTSQDKKTFIKNNSFLMNKLSEVSKVTSWEYLDKEFCTCSIVNGFHYNQCSVVECNKASVGARHVKILEQSYRVTLCRDHINTLEKPMNLLVKTTCL